MPLREWPTTAGQVTAGKLAIHLGAPRLGLRLQARAWQRDRGNYYAAYYLGWQILQYRGPLAAWDFAENYPDRPELEGWLRADMIGLRSRCATYLRDFQTADGLLRRAEEIAPKMPWLHVERADLLEAQDRLEEALAEAEKAFAIVPYYRPAVQAEAQLLQHLNRDDEVLAFLKEAMTALESGAVSAQLLQLQIELEQRGDTLATLEQLARLNALMEQKTREWIEYRRCEEPYFSGSLAKAAEAGERLGSKDPYYSAFVQRVRDLAATGQQPERRILPMGFVRQHHLTCVPATLTSIARYWGRPADHLEVAEQICYDGTSGLSERLWTEQNGFTAREFRITPEAVRTLVDRGVPFTMTTVEATNGHLQAGIGYDRCRQSVFVRDPSFRSKTEFVVEPFCERYASSGPRGMAVCPREEDERLANVQLPDAALFDQNHGLSVALQENDRERAQQIFDGMQAEHPEHRLTLGAKRTLANYDGNTNGQLDAVDALLQLFPGAAHLQLGRLSLLRALGRREEMIQWLKELSLKRETDAALLQEYANELTHDARSHALAMQLLKRARRYRRADGINLYVTAHIHWQRGAR